MLITCFGKFTTLKELRLPECLTAVFRKEPSAGAESLASPERGGWSIKIAHTLRTHDFDQITKNPLLQRMTVQV